MEQVLSKSQDNNTKQGGLDRQHDGLMMMMMMIMLLLLMMMMLVVVVVMMKTTMMMTMMMMMMMASQTLSRLRWYSYMVNESQ